jgi:hypothetical protein
MIISTQGKTVDMRQQANAHTLWNIDRHLVDIFVFAIVFLVRHDVGRAGALAKSVAVFEAHDLTQPRLKGPRRGALATGGVNDEGEEAGALA